MGSDIYVTGAFHALATRKESDTPCIIASSCIRWNTEIEREFIVGALC